MTMDPSIYQLPSFVGLNRTGIEAKCGSWFSNDFDNDLNMLAGNVTLLLVEVMAWSRKEHVYYHSELTNLFHQTCRETEKRLTFT